MDFANAYFRAKTIGTIKINQKVPSSSRLDVINKDGEHEPKIIKYLITSKADPNKLLYFLQKTIDLSQKDISKPQEF